MSKVDVARLWSLNFRIVNSTIVGVAGELAGLGLEPKELFVLAEIDGNPHPAALADALCMPKPTITVYLKNLESAGLVKREIDANDLRKHRLTVTPSGRKILTKGLALLSDAFGVRLSKLTTKQQIELQALLEAMSAP